MTTRINPELSVVIPVFNGVSTLAETHQRLSETLDDARWDHELIFVDDGSRDGSWDLIRRIAGADDRVIGLRLARNVGHAAAVAAGFDEARGSIVAMTDVDLETHPEDLPLLVRAIEDGADLASGRRTASRRLSRELPSRAFNAHTRRAGIDLHDIGCGTNAMRADVAKGFVSHSSGARQLVKPTLCALAGTVVEVPLRSVRPADSRLRAGDLITLWLEFDLGHRRPPFGAVSVLGAILLVGGAIAAGLGGILGSGSARTTWITTGTTVAVGGLLLATMGVIAGLVLSHLLTLATPRHQVAERSPRPRSEPATDGRNRDPGTDPS